MTGNALQVFGYEGKEIRTAFENGEVWVVAKDVCEVLEYARFDSNLIAQVPDEWKGTKRIRTLGGTQNLLCLSEQGLYFFLARSDKPKALPFQKWIAGDVLPSIRKHGGYLTPSMVEEALLSPDTIIRLATALKQEREQRQALAAKVEEDRPKVLFAEGVSGSSTSILVGDLAKILHQNGLETGQNRLFQTLRDRGFLIKDGSSRNMPTQRSMDLGLMEVREYAVIRSGGEFLVKKTPLVTGKGQIYFLNLFLRLHEEECKAS